ncbi:acyltransferase family protein [Bacillus songklensis]|uniref:Acyltransferase family protein n=1 Tax=Bacillus songklensis TaxID=1069116 RepID=A0ABV8B5P3_9BACI
MKTMNEVFWLRSLSCLTVVLLHAITTTIIHYYPSPDNSTHTILRSLQMLMMYGTPMFVFISEFLIAYRYRYGVKQGFLSKRVKFILIPYIVMGLFYAVVYQAPHGIGSILSKWGDHVFFGAYHGYFILIIFQFYILHLLFDRALRKMNAKATLFAAFVVNAAYLAFFNFNDPQNYGMDPDTWTRLTNLPFLAWLFYFVAGYYAGRYFGQFKQFVIKTRKWHLPFLVGSAALVLVLYHTEALVAVGSKRFDIILLTTAVMVIMFSTAFRLKRIPPELVVVSQYSFGIYLLHPFFQLVIARNIKNFTTTDNMFVLISIFFGLGVLLPMAVTNLLNRIPYGQYIVGKVGVGKKRETARQSEQAKAA